MFHCFYGDSIFILKKDTNYKKAIFELIYCKTIDYNLLFRDGTVLENRVAITSESINNESC